MKNTITFSDRFRGYMPVVIDVETGGFNHTSDALLEIAAVFIKLDKNGNFVPGNMIHNHIKPFSGSNLEPESLAINKIDPHNPFRMAIDEYDALEGIFDQTEIYLKKHKCKRAVLVGHNAAFDLNFINAAVKRCSLKNNPYHSFTCFDTATLCGLAYGHTVLAKAVNIAGFAWDPNQAHSAAYDARKTAEIFCDVVNRYKDIFERITVF